ncbi:LamB/YcsF family protein [Microbacterium sp. ZXX196]|uniref:LamB/YcsF family protein n=1 Tax=Microbacterium sp. ZXX196 TaxID=2609291 RepID=UPI0012B81D57|nr:5-oxoprolinase subunit PxpA [Microbacterium sp. ZXX196]MTE23333.1 5-oxoprolinase subunit PxpA [Microbacterium sp. ZXX196]
MTRRVDLVADLGEGYGAWRMGDDAALLDVLTSANVACGFHAGDPQIMDATVRACAERGVGIGAHPSFPDLRGFGRRDMGLTASEVRSDVLYQFGALAAIAAARGQRVTHLAPHGRLGNLVAVREDYADAVASAAARVDPSLIVLAQDGKLAEAARAAGLRVGIVGIADRAYEDDGTLVPRSEPGAVIHDAEEIRERTVRMVTDGVIDSRNGVAIPIACDTVLVHGDTDDAIRLARSIRAGLAEAGVEIAPLAGWLE